MKKVIFNSLAVIFVFSLLSGCSSVNPTAPQVDNSAMVSSQSAVQEVTLQAIKVFPNQAIFIGQDYRADVYYGSNGRMTSVRLSKYFGPSTTRIVLAQVLSLFTDYFATPPVPLLNASGQWGSYTATLKIGFHSDGNIIYIQQVNNGYTDIFCYDIFSQTQYSQRRTKYPLPISSTLTKD